LEERPIERCLKKGFCTIYNLKPSKVNGYVQISFGGVNKFCTLGEMLGWAAGFRTSMAEGIQVSHLCGEPRCMLPAHVVPESAMANNGRKNCVVWVNCPHAGCDLKIMACPHEPYCIKYVPGWES
jgi:hypothetical protein